MQFSVTPVQFATLKDDLTKAAGITLKLSDPNNGTLTTSDVTLACSYDGSSLLTSDVTAKHSFLAKFAPETAIEERIAAMFDQFLKA